MERQYVAIDLHSKRSLIVRENQAGEELGVTRIDNSPAALAAALAEAGQEPEVAIEAAYGWYWAVDVLQAEGAQVHLVHPFGLNWEERRVKNDYRDCKDLLTRMRMDRLPEAWIAPVELRELREMIRHRAKMVALRGGLKTQTKAVLAKLGLHPPVSDIWCMAGKAWLDSLSVPKAYATRIESLRDLVGAYDREIDIMERLIKDALRDHPGYQAIQAIDGVGQTLGAIFVAEIGDITRFPGPRQLCSWAGLTPKHRESDTKVRRGRVTKQGSKPVRWAAIEGVAHMHGGPKIKSDYVRIAKARGRNIARVAAARKLLTLVFYGLRDGEIRALAHAGEPA